MICVMILMYLNVGHVYRLISEYGYNKRLFCRKRPYALPVNNIPCSERAEHDLYEVYHSRLSFKFYDEEGKSITCTKTTIVLQNNYH